MQRKAAPSAADIEHALAWRKAKLPGYMPLFRKLGLLQRFGPRFEICAGVLLVLVQKQVVERAWKVVMAADVAPCLARIVHLTEEAREPAEAVGKPQPARQIARADIAPKQGQEIVDRAAGLKLDFAVHVAFGDGKLRIEEQRPLDPGIVEVDRHGFSGVVAEFVDIASPIPDFQMPGPDYRPERAPEQRGTHGLMKVELLGCAMGHCNLNLMLACTANMARRATPADCAKHKISRRIHCSHREAPQLCDPSKCGAQEEA